MYNVEYGKPTPVKRLLDITFPFTNYLIAQVTIKGQPGKDDSWNGIDGIGIVESVVPVTEPAIIKNLGPNINTDLSESSPRISPDGRTLYFTVEAHEDNVGMSRLDDDQDIWVSYLDKDDEWTKALHMGRPWNNETYNWVLNISPDGNAMLSSQYDSDGSYGGNGFSISRRNLNGWALPESMTILEYVNKESTADFFVSGDLQTALIAVKGKKSKGGHDIYVCHRINRNTFSVPLNLGAVINTKGAEQAPFLATDGKTMYFSSDRKGGFGDNDIWVTKRLDDTWTSWSEPVNLGAEVNSEDYDSDFSIAAKGDKAYLVRYADSYGEGDVFSVPLKAEVRPNPVVLISGRVLNKNTSEPIGANILYQLLKDGQSAGEAYSDPKTGEYKIALPYGEAYAFLGNVAGYYSVNENIDLTEVKEYEEINRDILMVPVEVGEVIRLNNIFFDFGKADLLDTSYPELDRVVKLLSENPKISIELSGHTDNVGSDTDNLKLSDDRAKSVVAYLISKKINGYRVLAKGYGESQPIASNDNEEGRLLNRRVEFKITEI